MGSLTTTDEMRPFSGRCSASSVTCVPWKGARQKAEEGPAVQADQDTQLPRCVSRGRKISYFLFYYLLPFQNVSKEFKCVFNSEITLFKGRHESYTL